MHVNKIQTMLLLEVLPSVHAFQEHTESVSEAVDRVVAGYGAGASATARSGTALALKACTPCLGPQQVPAVLDFLLGRGLADADDDVRAQMVAAGGGRLCWTSSCS